MDAGAIAVVLAPLVAAEVVALSASRTAHLAYNELSVARDPGRTISPGSVARCNQLRVAEFVVQGRCCCCCCCCCLCCHMEASMSNSPPVPFVLPRHPCISADSSTCLDLQQQWTTFNVMVRKLCRAVNQSFHAAHAAAIADSTVTTDLLARTQTQRACHTNPTPLFWCLKVLPVCCR